ncbi:MAG: thioredoxin family protein [Patescibacteria group bacterium]|jgi:small redox-active disulfide protein 2
MTIFVLGSGCPNCKQFFEQVKQAVSELKLDVRVEYSNDIQKMIELGAMSSPVLVVNDKIALAGQVPGVEKIKEILTNCYGAESGGANGCSCGSC